LVGGKKKFKSKEGENRGSNSKLEHERENKNEEKKRGERSSLGAGKSEGGRQNREIPSKKKKNKKIVKGGKKGLT